MKIVMTGACGHIGSSAIRSFAGSFPGLEIVMLDNLATQRYCSLFNLPEGANYRFLEGDARFYDLRDACAGADVVVHLAAITDAAGTSDKPELVESVNLNATRQVAETCLNSKVPLIFISSTSVYGVQGTVVDEHCAPEDLKPQSPYAATKLKEERLLRDLSDRGLRYAICRFGTICGVSPGMRFHTAINKFCWQAVMGQPLSVWRTALYQQRPYLSLDEGCESLKFIIENRLFDCETYNVLSRNMTVAEIIAAIRSVVADVAIELVDCAIMNQLSYEVSDAKFRGKGFVYRGQIERSIVETVAWLSRAGGLK
jgi:nucleoside-diphosphate-sugar epimerase